MCTDSLESDRANDEPLAGHQSLDITDFHTRLRLALKGMSPSKTRLNRHAILAESRKYWKRKRKGIPEAITLIIVEPDGQTREISEGEEYDLRTGIKITKEE